MAQLLTLFIIANIVIWIIAIYKTSFQHQPFHITPLLAPLGIFVWGDSVIFSFFWFASASLCLYLNDFILFGLTFSVFWVIRGLGETIYWISEQFATNHRNHPHTLIGSRIFPQDSIHFAYQIIAQTITIIAILTSVYFAHLWLTVSLH